MKRQWAYKLVLTLAVTFVALPVVAQDYKLSGKWNTMTWSSGSWKGQHNFPGVYCLTYPAASTATELGSGFFNGGAIHFTQVRYPERVGAFIVVSTVPNGRSASDEVARLLSLERQAEAGYGTSYNIVETDSALGTVLNLKIKDVAPESRNGPFPLVRPIIRPAKKPIESLSVHRVFVRGPDRFEVAVLQLAPERATENTESVMATNLTALADQIVASLQECTASIPLRAPR